jgi:serine/threonine-protein kinase
MQPTHAGAACDLDTNAAARHDLLATRASPLVAGKYRLVRPLGVGGMGVVWEAKNEATGAEVALKVLRHDVGGGKATFARFRREARVTAQLAHRGIVRVYDLLEFEAAGGRGACLAMVMELLRGRTLEDFMTERGAVPPHEAAAIVLPVLAALGHAHAHGVVHRDIKPANVFLAIEADGLRTPKLLDFGVAKQRLVLPGARLTASGQTVGTPSFMSPEQLMGLDVDARSDLFSVGILLHQLLGGASPFAENGPYSVMVAILENEPLVLPQLSPALRSVLRRALRKSPDERFSSANEMATALRAAVGSTAPVQSLRSEATTGAVAIGAHGIATGPLRGTRTLVQAVFRLVLGLLTHLHPQTGTLGRWRRALEATTCHDDGALGPARPTSA